MEKLGVRRPVVGSIAWLGLLWCCRKSGWLRSGLRRAIIAWRSEQIDVAAMINLTEESV